MKLSYLHLRDIEIELSAFADDTTFFVRNKELINRLLNIMRKFGELVGLGVQSVEQTSQLFVKLPASLEVQ